MPDKPYTCADCGATLDPVRYCRPLQPGQTREGRDKLCPKCWRKAVDLLKEAHA